MKLTANTYGKGRVRVVRVIRDTPTHQLKEVTVQILVEGELASSYTKADNSKVVPTDTMKNTVYALAKEHLRGNIEDFGIAIGRHFLSHYAQLSKIKVDLHENRWERIRVKGKPHPHSFVRAGSEKPFARVASTRKGVEVESGVTDLLVRKTTGSSFEGYPRDKYTTLPETKDRIFGTSLTATWRYAQRPRDYTATNQAILQAMLEVFAREHSASVQATLYDMGKAALATARAISEIRLAMPNQHCLLVNLKPFGLENPNEVFVATDEPHGQIEATIAR